MIKRDFISPSGPPGGNKTRAVRRDEGGTHRLVKVEMPRLRPLLELGSDRFGEPH